jgi:hypothetical protein
MPGWEHSDSPGGGDDAASSRPASPVTFHFARNWTAVAFFGLLGALHLTMAASALMSYRWEAYMSVAFGGLFAAVAVACALVRHDVIVRPGRRRIIVRTGLGRVGFERLIPFSAVTCVRVLLLGRNGRESSVSIVCDTDEVELPPTRTPRQEGLLLAMLIDVRLVKIYGDGPPPEAAERIAKLFRNEDAV